MPTTGDLGDYMHDKEGLADLSWLELEPGKNYDNIPTGNLAEVIPQLQEAWTHGPGRSTNFIPNQVMDTSIGVKPVSPEVIQMVAKRAKRAIMAGMPSNEIIASLQDRFDVETLNASTDELKKVASEQGLLGNVYIDLSCFDTCKEASRVLGKHRTRLASYAIGAPTKEADFKDDFGRCRDLGKQVVASIEYNEELFAKYEPILRAAGKLASDEKITSKEDLKLAFERLPVKQKVAEEKVAAPISKEVVAAAKEKVAQLVSKEAQQEEKIRIAAARPVMAQVQNLMLRGLMGDSLKQALGKSLSPDLISKFASEIKNAVSLQGLLGTFFVDVSHYASTEDAVQSIKRASTSPKYVMASAEVEEGRVERIASLTGCKILTKDGVDFKVASSVIDSLSFGGKIASSAKEELLGKLASGMNPLSVIREAYSAINGLKDVRQGGVQATYNASMYQPEVDKSAEIRTAAEKAIKAGISVDQVEAKVASMVPASEAFGTVRSIVSSLTEIGADSLNKCTSEKYPLNPSARIAASVKCAACIHSTGGACVKQGVKFAVDGSKTSMTAKKASGYSSPSEEFGLTSSLDVDFTGVVEPPKTDVEGSYLDPSAGMDDYLS